MAENSTALLRLGSWPSALLLSAALAGCTAQVAKPGVQGASGAGASSGAGGASTTSGGSANGGSSGSTDTTNPSCSNLAPIQRRLWRLSVEQFQNSLEDLLELPSAPLLTNRGGEAQWAFFSDASLGVDDSFQYALYQVVDGALPNIPKALTTCNAGEAPAACATRIATSFGARAFRRPLSAIELAALVSNPAQPATGASAAVSAAPFLAGGSDTQLGLKLMIEAILLSPSFIYRTELGPSTLTADANGKYPDSQLTPYEVAAQLGFTFLGSVPDAALEAAATDTSEQGLGSVTGITAQVDRLLALPAVKQNLTSIVAGWFDIGQLFLKTHDTSFLAALPSADQQDQTGIQSDLYAAAQQLITDTLWTNPGKVSDLLSTPKVSSIPGSRRCTRRSLLRTGRPLRSRLSLPALGPRQKTASVC
ncbi:MAG TPA: DUF1595 domain-containing protein [Polyangiaceae bacterium]